MKIIVNGKTDITSLVKSVEWSGSSSEISRKLSITALKRVRDQELIWTAYETKTKDDRYKGEEWFYLIDKLSKVAIDEHEKKEYATVKSMLSRIYIDFISDHGELLFRGIVIEQSVHTDDHFITFSCFDFLINFHYFSTLTTNKPTKDRLKDEINDRIGLFLFQGAIEIPQGWELGWIDDIDISQTIYPKSTMYEKMYYMCKSIYEKTQQPYVIRGEGYHLCVRKRGTIIAETKLSPRHNLLTAEYTERTVLDTDVEKRKTERKISAEAFGADDLITGNAVFVEDKNTGIIGKFYIDEDTHTFENGVHKVSLTLNDKNIMPEPVSGNQEETKIEEKAEGGSAAVEHVTRSGIPYNPTKEFSKDPLSPVYRTGLSASQLAQVINQTFPKNKLIKDNSENLTKGFTQTLADVETNLGISSFFVLAIIHAENPIMNGSFSRIVRDKNNIMSWNAVNHDPYRKADKYASYAEAIKTPCIKLRENYLDPKGKYFKGYSISGVSKHYCLPPGPWANNVTNYVRKLANTAKSLGFEKHGGRMSEPVVKSGGTASGSYSGKSKYQGVKPGTKREKMLDYAFAQQGKPYTQDGRRETSHFDCSSFIARCMMHVGAYANWKGSFNTRNMRSHPNLKRINKSELMAGDVGWKSGHTEMYMWDGKTYGAHAPRVPLGWSGRNSVNMFTQYFRIQGID